MAATRSRTSAALRPETSTPPPDTPGRTRPSYARSKISAAATAAATRSATRRKASGSQRRSRRLRSERPGRASVTDVTAMLGEPSPTRRLNVAAIERGTGGAAGLHAAVPGPESQVGRRREPIPAAAPDAALGYDAARPEWRNRQTRRT